MAKPKAKKAKQGEEPSRKPAAKKPPCKQGGEASRKKPAKKPAAQKPAAKTAAATACRSRRPSRSARPARRSTACSILDFTHVQSGPTCTQLLGYMGADCIKVERPGVGDITRGQLRDVKGAGQPLLHHAQRQQALDHHRLQASQGQGDPRAPDQALRRAGGEFRARRARPHGADLGATSTRPTRA